MAKYVDGYILPVKRKNLVAYRKMAQEMGRVWRKCGALEYVECVGDDLKPNMGGMKVTQFPKCIKSKPGETVIFSYVVFKSRTHRDAVNAKVNKDPIMRDPKYKNMPMPFEVKRMVYGGFKTIVEA